MLSMSGCMHKLADVGRGRFGCISQEYIVHVLYSYMLYKYLNIVEYVHIEHLNGTIDYLSIFHIIIMI